MNPLRLVRLACGVFKLGRFDIIRTDLHRWEVRDRNLPPALRRVAVCSSAVRAIQLAEEGCRADVEQLQCSLGKAAGAHVAAQ